MNKSYNLISKWKLQRLTPHAKPSQVNRWLKAQLSNLPRDFTASRLCWEHSPRKSTFLRNSCRLAAQTKNRLQRGPGATTIDCVANTKCGNEKRLPMNKIQVGAAPSPNLIDVKAKIGSLANTCHKPGGGDKKIFSQRLQWEAKSKIGSFDNAKYKPGGGCKKIFDDKYYLRQGVQSNEYSILKNAQKACMRRHNALAEESRNMGHLFEIEVDKHFKRNRSGSSVQSKYRKSYCIRYGRPS